MTVNFACVIWHTSQDRTSWTSHFKLQESYKMEGTCFSGTFHFIRFLKFKEFITLGNEPLFGSFWIFGFSGLASGYHPLAQALKSRKTLKGVPSTINCRYKKFDFLLSGTFHFVRFLKFKKFIIMLGKEPLFGNLDFQALPQKNHPWPLQIQEDPQRGSLPLYIADTRDLISCSTQRGGWWLHGKSFYFRKINIKDKRRTLDSQQEILLQKMNIKDCKFGSPTQLPFSTTIIMSMQTEFDQNRNQKSLICKPTTHRGKSCTLMRCKTKLEMGNGRNLTLHPSPIQFQLPIMLWLVNGNWWQKLWRMLDPKTLHKNKLSINLSKPIQP